MVEILAIKTGDACKFDPDERLPDPEDIMVICSSLISYNKKELFEAVEDKPNVRFPEDSDVDSDDEFIDQPTDIKDDLLDHDVEMMHIVQVRLLIFP